MFFISCIIPVLCIASIHSAQINEIVSSHESPNNIWAVLIAGSHRWIRYRHQANVCHAYKLLIENGIPKDRIITFMYNDIAYNEKNPEPGVLRNEPYGPNVYAGVPIDYSGEDVRKEIFLDVIQGHKMAVRGYGSGRVVLSTHKDNIFIYHTGLGGHNGYIEFPNDAEDTNLRGEDLVQTFKHLHDRKKYKNILMYLESSHSGAMFDNLKLPHNLSVMAMTAGGPDEDTYGVFCDINIEPCLAGLYSYAWINYAENLPVLESKFQSVFDHYDAVRNNVANTTKEHPQIYGDWNVGKLPISNFIGFRKNEPKNSKMKNKLLIGIRKDYKFHLDSAMTTVNGKTKTNNMKILNKIFKLVLPNEHVRNQFMLKPSTDLFQNQCLGELLLLFNEKCSNQNDFNAQQKETNILAKLCDPTILLVEQMTAAEAIEKICI